jgi:hypothetical protein
VILTYTTNAAEDAALAHILARRNEERAAMNPPLPPIPDVQTLNQALVQQTIASYIQQKARYDVLQTLTPAQRTALGL